MGKGKPKDEKPEKAVDQLLLDVLLPPADRIDRKVALRFLQGDFLDLFAALRAGYWAKDEGVRGDCAFIASDLERLAGASIAAIAAGDLIDVVRAEGVLDWQDNTRALARVIAAVSERRDEIGTLEGDREQGITLLTRMLIERLSRKAAA